jgi:hypothetical protein
MWFNFVRRRVIKRELRDSVALHAISISGEGKSQECDDLHRETTPKFAGDFGHLKDLSTPFRLTGLLETELASVSSAGYAQ